MSSPVSIAVPLLWSPWRWGCLAVLGRDSCVAGIFLGIDSCTPSPASRRAPDLPGEAAPFAQGLSEEPSDVLPCGSL